jgi:hypothetical protein
MTTGNNNNNYDFDFDNNNQDDVIFNGVDNDFTLDDFVDEFESIETLLDVDNYDDEDLI